MLGLLCVTVGAGIFSIIRLWLSVAKNVFEVFTSTLLMKWMLDFQMQAADI